MQEQEESMQLEPDRSGSGVRDRTSELFTSELLTSEESATTWDRFQRAALSLARSGPIKDRLAEAYRNHLAEVREEELPREMREEFRAVSRALTRERPMRGEDAVRATIRKMSNEEADRIACAVVRMFGELPHVPAAARHSIPAQVVPLYANER